MKKHIEKDFDSLFKASLEVIMALTGCNLFEARKGLMRIYIEQLKKKKKNK